MKGPYKDGVTLEEILADGWSRGFNPNQTREEALFMGYEITREEIIADWAVRNEEMLTDMGL